MIVVNIYLKFLIPDKKNNMSFLPMYTSASLTKKINR